jgi:hypothetical protein
MDRNEFNRGNHETRWFLVKFLQFDPFEKHFFTNNHLAKHFLEINKMLGV